MNIAFLRQDFWGIRLDKWMPIDFSIKGGPLGCYSATGVGRRNENEEYQAVVWMEPDGPDQERSWFKNWRRPYITSGEPEVLEDGTVVLRHQDYFESLFKEHAIFLVYDLHRGRRAPKEGDDQKGVFVPNPETTELWNFIVGEYDQTYPWGMMVVYPGFKATLTPEKADFGFTLWYESFEKGLILIPEMPSSAAYRMAIHPYMYRHPHYVVDGWV